MCSKHVTHFSLLAFLLFQHPESLQSTASHNITRCVMTQDNPPEKKECKVEEDQKSIASECRGIKRSLSSPTLSTSQHLTHPLSVGWRNWFHFTFVRFVTCSGLMNTRQKKLYVHTCAAEWFLHIILSFPSSFSSLHSAARLNNISLHLPSRISLPDCCDISFNLNLSPRICHLHTISSLAPRFLRLKN